MKTSAQSQTQEAIEALKPRLLAYLNDPCRGSTAGHLLAEMGLQKGKYLPNGLPESRLLDRTLQALRKSGDVQFEDRQWGLALKPGDHVRLRQGYSRGAGTTGRLKEIQPTSRADIQAAVVEWDDKELGNIALNSLERLPLPLAVCLYMRRDDGRILAVSRKTDRTKFGLVGGKVDPGETLLTALARETLEEAGLVVSHFKFVLMRICPGEVDYLAFAFEAHYEGDLHDLKTAEPIDIEWVEPQVLLDGPFGEFNAELFRREGLIQ